jgi:hypothetical protein
MANKIVHTTQEGANYNHESFPQHLKRLRVDAHILANLLYSLQTGQVITVQGDKLPDATKVNRSFMGWDGCFNIVLESKEFEQVWPNHLIPELKIVLTPVKMTDEIIAQEPATKEEGK